MLIYLFFLKSTMFPKHVLHFLSHLVLHTTYVVLYLNLHHIAVCIAVLVDELNMQWNTLATWKVVGIDHRWYVIVAIQCPAQSKAKTEVLAADWEGTVWTRSPTTRDQFPFYYLPKNREFIYKLIKLYPTYILECCCQARRGWIGTANFAEGRTSVLKGVWETVWT